MKEVYLILDNIRSAQNVGTIIRTAEAAGVKEIFLCGITPTLENKKLLKTSLGAEKTIKILHSRSTFELIEKLQKKNIYIVSLELTKNSKDYSKTDYKYPLALVVGNEVSGISDEILNESDKIIEIPMRGKKNSLNVTVAAGIAIYHLT